jgi:hypothetical protein
VTDYVLEASAKWPNCLRDILEKTLIEPAVVRKKLNPAGTAILTPKSLEVGIHDEGRRV